MQIRCALVGMPGSGKSTVGRHLAQRLGVPFIDLDHQLEQVLKTSIRQFFEAEGEARFRDIEAQVLAEVDVLILLDVYPAGEKPLAGADGRSLSRAIRTRGKVDPVFVEQAADLPAALPGLLRDGDLLLLMGAGDIGAMAVQLGRDGLVMSD